MRKLSALLFACLAVVLTGCSGKQPEKFDYTEFEKSKPRSILVVMPTNSSPDEKADTSVLAQATKPIAEKGYYVFPVALVDEVFKQNGLTDGFSIQNTSIKKLHEIFGADAVMYIDVEKYGSSYQIFDSVTEVSVRGKLVDLRTGASLWEGTGSFKEGQDNSGNNAIVQLISAAVNQVINTVSDRGYKVAAMANHNLVSFGKNGGLLNGPYLPEQQKK